ncbi:cysteine-rich receptor-like protein kinase 10 [Beta vulgaris subsp. vulgaris]|uniref:cysteine-rich receptor-like protein kinase 10 n=1 Tax=Beta vulgaris subsp. vulgaris TaxID=3555 RepID=UPI0020370C52|nr:cysteine-rich receptor-like protein kinase 10 [Beta vulgaris subsp. vulgaris]
MAQTSRSSIFVLVPLLLAFVVLLIPRSTSAQHLWGYHCPNTTMFANNSQYETNLNAVFHSLSSNATNPSGYAQAVARNGSNEAVYGHFLCRLDQPAASCRDCLVTATTNDLPRIRCPNRKVAIIWYDECMVRYSNESFFRRMDADPWFPLTNEKNITGNITQFMDAVGNMMNDLRVRTSNGGPQKKYAADASKYSSLVTQYGLAQCTPDISASQCNKCLSIAIGMLATSIGARAVMPSCNVRYEIDPFFEGATDISLPPSSSLPSPPPMSSPDGKKKVSTKGILAIVVPLAATSLFMLCIWICYRKRKSKSKFEPIENGEELITVESLQYGLSTLQVATNNFSDENKLGEGGFGSVYKGILSTGQNIAVKRLSLSSSQGIQQFKNEVMLVAKLQHRNLVRVSGFCLAGEEKLLVYEYVFNKSLDYFLFDKQKQGQLNWERRYNVILGVARGMLYLHHDSRLTIVHRDLKASNVLLDVDMNPKISDFGLARIFEMDQTEANTNRVVGTYGYMSPEYAMHGKFSPKSDVYSFGVLVFETISGKRINSFYESCYAEDLLSYAWKQWIAGTPLEFVDATIRGSCSLDEVVRCMNLGFLCVQESVDDRPTMATIVLMLEGQSLTLTAPKEPTLCGKSSIFSKHVESDQSNNKSILGSVNDVSITEMEPR